jgi:uncharacterized protein (TIGR03066 family)
MKTRKPLAPMWRPGPTVKAVGFWSDDRFLAAATDTDLRGGRVMITRKAGTMPRDESAERIKLWVEVCTGISSELSALSPTKWRETRRDLLKLGDMPGIEAAIQRELAAPRSKREDGYPERLAGPPVGPKDPDAVALNPNPHGPDKEPERKPPMGGKIDGRLLIGKWEWGGEGMTVEFAEGGKLTVSFRFAGQPRTERGTYQLDGNNLDISFTNGAYKSTITLTNLTEKEIAGINVDGEKETFTRVSAPGAGKPATGPARPPEPRVMPKGEGIGGLRRLGQLIFGRP